MKNREPHLKSQYVPLCTKSPQATRSKIARRYGVDYGRLMALNGITNPYNVKIGTEICIPPAAGTGAGSNCASYYVIRERGYTLRHRQKLRHRPGEPHVRQQRHRPVQHACRNENLHSAAKAGPSEPELAETKPAKRSGRSAVRFLQTTSVRHTRRTASRSFPSIPSRHKRRTAAGLFQTVASWNFRKPAVRRNADNAADRSIRRYRFLRHAVFRGIGFRISSDAKCLRSSGGSGTDRYGTVIGRRGTGFYRFSGYGRSQYGEQKRPGHQTFRRRFPL